MSGGSVVEEVVLELVKACSSGDVQTLYYMLSQYTDPAYVVNLTSEGGVTLLMHTIIGAGAGTDPTSVGLYAECCSLLVQSGAELETADTTYGRTAAHWAVYYHRDDILVVLIESGADMTCPDFTGTSPFHLALQESAITCLDISLQLLPKEILDIPHPQFLFPFLHAVQCGDREACQLLIRAGADVNQIDEESGRTALHFATELNDRDLVDFLISCEGLLDVVDVRGLTPLHIASIIEGKGALEAIVRRVGGGEVLDIRDSQGLTPLMHACLNGNTTSVKLLLKRKADVLAQDSEGKHCLHYAAESSSLSAHDTVQCIVKKNKQLLDIKDELGRTPLLMCAISGTVATLDVLLTSGCSLDDMDSSNQGLVHWSTVSGNPTVLSKLIDLGCPVNVVDSLGTTPLHYACQQAAEPDIAVYTEDAMNRSERVQQCVGVLLRGGAAINYRDGHGMEPLHHAVQFSNNLQACQLLLEYGSDPYSKTEAEGLTGLHLAARGGITDACQYLLERTGGRLGTVVDSEGQTALHYAVGSGALECVEYLLQAGLSPHHPNNNYRTPSHIAASVGSFHCLQLLKGYGANLGAVSIDGATPLHEAAVSGHVDAVEFLLSSDSALINKGAGQSKATPLHYAVHGGHEECIRLLLEWGAKVNALSISEEGERLSTLDLCDPDSAIYELLTQHGALPGTEVTQQEQEEIDFTAESAFKKDEAEGMVRGGVSTPTDDDEALSIPSVRPTTPSRQSFVGDPIFEDDRGEYATSSQQPSRVPTPVTPPPASPDIKKQGPGILKKVFRMLKKKPSQQTKDSIWSSAVGFYAAQVTMLAAAVIGTSLGEQVREVAEKVVTDTAQELKKAAAIHEGEFPELVWLREETDGLHTQSPSPPPTPTPTPPTPPPPIPKVMDDPYERRMRKAKAQLDTSKSPAFLAVEELMKAQNMHMKLKRQFQEERLQEAIKKRREDFNAKELKAKLASEKVMKRLEEKLNRATTESEAITKDIDKQLAEVRKENHILSTMMGELGVNPRPTVAQWLQRKQLEKKAALQDTLIRWDRGRQRREAAILVQQAALSRRAMKHAAWGAKKDLGSKIKALKRSPYRASLNIPPPNQPKLTSTTTKTSQKDNNARKLKPNPITATTVPTRSFITPPPSNIEVMVTTTGFKKVKSTSSKIIPKRSKITPTSMTEPIWKVGEDYVMEDKISFPPSSIPPSAAFLRATGPKTVHAERTLHFLPPDEYKAMKAADRAMKKQLSQQYGIGPRPQAEGQRSPRKSAIVIHSLDFDQQSIPVRKDVSLYKTEPYTARYHSLADNINGRSMYPQQPSSNIPVLPMTVLDPTQLPSVAAK